MKNIIDRIKKILIHLFSSARNIPDPNISNKNVGNEKKQYSPILIKVENKSDHAVKDIDIFGTAEHTIPGTGWRWDNGSLKSDEIEISSGIYTISYKNILLAINARPYSIIGMYIRVPEGQQLPKKLTFTAWKITGSIVTYPCEIVINKFQFQQNVILLDQKFLLDPEIKITLDEVKENSIVYLYFYPDFDYNYGRFHTYTDYLGRNDTVYPPVNKEKK